MPSSVIRSYQYQPEKEILTVTFVTGKVYEYFPVPKDLYEEFTKAFAKGVHFNKYIKPGRTFKKIAG